MKKLFALALAIAMAATQLMGGITAFAAGTVKLGDVNDDGIINASDALAVLEHAANIAPITEERGLMAADIEVDGVINAADALYILNIAAGIVEDPNKQQEGIYMQTKTTGDDYIEIFDYDEYGNMSLYEYSYDDGEYQDKYKCTYEYTYDENGIPQSLLETIISNDDVENAQHYQTTYTYDENGYLIMQDCTDLGTDKVLSINQYEYDEYANTTKEISKEFDEEGTEYTEIYEYTYADGYLVTDVVYTVTYGGELLEEGTSEFTYDADGNNTRVYAVTKTLNHLGEWYTDILELVCTYDENGFLVEEKNIYSIGTIVIAYKYNDKGQIIEVKETDVDGAQSMTTAEYNEEGLEVKMTSVYADGSVHVTDTEYNGDGMPVKVTTAIDGEQTYQELMEYDAVGNLIKFTSIYEDGTTSVEKYEYQLFQFKF